MLLGGLIKQTSRLADNVAVLSDNAAAIAIGIAKMTERCFCGHLLDLHPESGACTVEGCNVAGHPCQGFMPIHLAASRLLNVIASELTAIRKIFQQPMGDISRIFH